MTASVVKGYTAGLVPVRRRTRRPATTDDETASQSHNRRAIMTWSTVVTRFAVVLPSLLLLLPSVSPADVLVFMPMPLKSHVGGFQPLFEELAIRGHNVTVVSAFPRSRPLANYTDVYVPPTEIKDFDSMKLAEQNFLIALMSRWFFSDILSNVLEKQVVKDFIASESYSFDLVITESFYQEYTVALGHKFNAPVINLAPAMPWASMSKWLHLPSTFSYVPDCCIGATDQMSFVERLKNTVVGTVQLYVEDYVYVPMMETLMDKHFTYKGWESRPPLGRMLSNVSLTLMNAHHAIGVCRPYLPGVVEVGGLHIKEPKPLPRDLQDYIDSATDGVIFFSFGSFLNLSHLPKEKLNIFLDVVGRLKQKIILKWVPDGTASVPQNVKTGSWLPQNDILAHPNVKLFITHGGFHSVEEAVYNAKPVVGIPFFADQHSNMRNAEKKGFGKLVDLFQLTEESFESAVKEVLSNPTFGEKAIAQSMTYRDQPTKPMDRAVYWIEYVIRHDGAKFLISDAVDLNSSQYFLLDVAFVLLAPAGFVTWLCYRGVKRVTSKFKTD